MKSRLGWLLAAVCALSFGVARGWTAGRAQTARVATRDYIRVSDWAQANDFSVRWLKKEEVLQLSKSSASITLNVDSNDADVNGIGLRLCFPVAYRDGTAFLSQTDAQETLRPLLFPPRNKAGATVRNICLDPGHGGSDPGNGVGSRVEKKYTLLLADELRDQLTRAGFKVSLTRTRDVNVELDSRPEVARRRGADLFISLHFNSAPSSANTVRGAEVYCMTPPGAPSSNARGEGGSAGWFPGNRNNEKNVYLAYLVQRSLTKGLGMEDRGVHRARFAVLREATMPAVLIEGGFMSHPVEGRNIADPAYRRQMARTVMDGIIAYKRQVEGSKTGPR
jgi:N-acetylmuramoyl-L-alanine amidase